MALVHEAEGTLVLGNSESGLAYRSAILHYGTISSPIPASVIDVKLVCRWSVPVTATSLDPGEDNEITSYEGVTGGSPDGSKIFASIIGRRTIVFDRWTRCRR